MKLDIMFTTWGSPETLASDNGPQFMSNQFQDWCRLNGIVHLTSVPCHSTSFWRGPTPSGYFQDATYVGWEVKQIERQARLPRALFASTVARRTLAELLFFVDFFLFSSLINVLILSLGL